MIIIFVSFQIPKEEEENTHLLQRHSLNAARYTDKKIVLIPLLFILLRIWGTIRFFLLLQSDTLSYANQLNFFEIALLYLQVRISKIYVPYCF